MGLLHVWGKAMDCFPVPGFRFSEVQKILAAYAAVDCVFTDTSEWPGPALESHLGEAAQNPESAAKALRQIDDLLSVDLFSAEIRDEVALMPQVSPTGGRSVEESFWIIRKHLVSFLEGDLERPVVPPQKPEEWRERSPEISHLLGAYFHQDSLNIYASHREAVDDYISGTPAEDRRRAAKEGLTLLRMVEDKERLEDAVLAVGMQVYPPRGVRLRRWMTDLADIIKNDGEC
ncbi:contact-dependent growth inhibition system immunity protein [Streptomyces sp. TRM 70361]|uniref:contact-dependent growth inhibition system immunity protein n=1 Tax=Streptomyces sp. TRM 70361 TaxID=3116553 RepID=UPI002E7C4E7E|nr:contact-dependent growth inhibition system immunity protein [Streptomyces sp. TRM 70361]MEE1940520.1 contact-dependent growth inhibition system immunity protein [Streptomyces sp. TRM 70361]